MTRLDPGDLLARRYLLLAPLAWGGMSVIWRAFDQSLQRLVAIKVLTASLQTGLGDRVRVRSEARAAARFIHPDVVEIYDYGETVTTGGGVAAYVVMPLLEGQTLADHVATGPLPWTEAAGIALRLALVLRDGHALGLVHRDVTAENVLLTAGGPKLLDFGIAASTGDPDDDRGTPPYVAPERLTGAPTHPAVDVYALGVLLFIMLTGRTPYPETTWEQIEAVRRTSPPPRATGAPHGVASLCRHCLAHDPEQRPTAAEIAESLSGVLRAAAVGRRVRRGLAVLAGGAALAAAVTWVRLPAGPGPETVTPAATAPASAVAPDAGLDSSPDANSAGNSAGASPSARVTTRVPVTARTVRRAVDGFHVTLEGKNACLATDNDVALDLRQVLGHVVDSSGPSGPGVAEVRRKLADREREGRLAPTCRAELDARLDEIATALRVE